MNWLYIKIGAGVAIAALMWYMGFSFEHSRFVAFKATIVAEQATIERTYQAKAAQIESDKNAQIKIINAQLVDAVSELRKRPGRASEASNGQSCNGASLYAEDAEFLVREAARADEIRSGLQACYKQYDSLK